MGRAPCCDKANVKKGPWSPEEDAKLREYIDKQGTGGNWIALPQKAGLKRCGKSCRLRWLNYLRPNIKHGEFSDDEDKIIIGLYANIGSRWSIIAAQLPGRTDNDIKNYWNTKLKKKLMAMIPSSQRRPHQATTFSSLLQAQSLPSSPSTPSMSTSSSYKCSTTNNYYTLVKSFTEPVSFSSSPLSSSTNSLITTVSMPPQESSFVGSMQSYQVKDNMLMFGGDQASCSSSDGSCNNNQIGQSNELENNEYCGEQIGLQQSFLYNGGASGGWNDAKQNGLWGDNNPLDYGLEEIKQLISSNSCNNNFLFDENKTERVMYY